VKDPHVERAVDTLVACAAEWSGYQVESMAREAVRRALATELARGATITDVLSRAAQKDPELVRVLRSAVGVRETYFFRNPEQFALIASRIGDLAAGGVVRAWSAGCATGEETWSLAATIVANLPDHKADPTQTLVVGTDIHEPGLEHARGGVYRSNAQRASGPLLYPVVRQSGDKLHVIEPLKTITSFALHDLREPPPGEFELIFCRNVLIYFARPVAQAILGHLAKALVPGGLLALGTMDADAADLPKLARLGPPELMVFTPRPSAPSPTRRRPTTLKMPQQKPASALPEQTIALHRSALMWIELGGRSSVDKALFELNRAYPDYVPGLLERALLHARKGDLAGAISWMKEVLKRTEGLPDDQLVPGLEELPASFYRTTARAYLERNGGMT
jgi:chemotaxis methyl-accepting protein methylase